MWHSDQGEDFELNISLSPNRAINTNSGVPRQ